MDALDRVRPLARDMLDTWADFDYENWDIDGLLVELAAIDKTAENGKELIA